MKMLLIPPLSRHHRTYTFEVRKTVFSPIRVCTYKVTFRNVSTDQIQDAANSTSV
jgi:hypothetical protein